MGEYLAKAAAVSLKEYRVLWNLDIQRLLPLLDKRRRRFQ